MMDPNNLENLLGMAFAFLMSVTFLVTIGAVILLKPLMKNLGNYLEAKAEEGRALGGRSSEDWDRLMDNLDTFAERLRTIEERQEFTEKLLARPGEVEEKR